MDSSALVKRYLPELGSHWVANLTDQQNEHIINIAEVTQVEVAAALAARQRAPDGISRQLRDSAVNILAQHCKLEYNLVAMSPYVIDRAVNLTQRYRLRGYDAVQLATALVVNAVLFAANNTALIFVTADKDLLKAAKAEGLTAENPNNYL
ncbi:MAG: type II toxin-antitoxin system VapC family toxin [Chloroflexi bacterium]|nr:type II toxin-antitoxin system VapC family toxin [Chloroflexota bacterium]